MTDIIERAEAVLAGRHVGDRVSSVVRIYGSVITDLVAELKAARAETLELRTALVEVGRIAMRSASGDQSNIKLVRGEAK